MRLRSLGYSYSPHIGRALRETKDDILFNLKIFQPPAGPPNVGFRRAWYATLVFASLDSVELRNGSHLLVSDSHDRIHASGVRDY